MQRLQLSMDNKGDAPRQTLRRKSIRSLPLLPRTFHERHRKMLGASPSTILDWIRRFGNEHTQPSEPQTEAVVLELDEMWHYLKKKQTLDLENFVS